MDLVAGPCPECAYLDPGGGLEDYHAAGDKRNESTDEQHGRRNTAEPGNLHIANLTELLSVTVYTYILCSMYIPARCLAALRRHL